jgi:hypothetical protein
MLGIMFLGEGFIHLHELHADNTQTTLLEAFDDFARQAPLNGVGLNDDECSFHVKRFSCFADVTKGGKSRPF